MSKVIPGNKVQNYCKQCNQMVGLEEKTLQVEWEGLSNHQKFWRGFWYIFGCLTLVIFVGMAFINAGNEIGQFNVYICKKCGVIILDEDGNEWNNDNNS